MYDMFLFHGHGEGDVGAVANGYKEIDLARELTKKCVDLLEGRGVKVLTNIASGYNNYNRNLTSNVKYNMGATIHLNSEIEGVARGVEIIVPLKEGYLGLETEILENLRVIGYRNRGLKSRDYHTEAFSTRVNGNPSGGLDYYKEIRDAFAKGNSLSIIEVGFISNKDDVALFKSRLHDIAIAIVNPYLKEMGKGIYSNPPTGTNVNKTLYKVQVGAFREKSNADKLVNELKNKGYSPFIVKEEN